MADPTGRVYLQVLVVRCQLGDRDAFAEIVALCQPRLRAFLHKMLPRPHQVDDVAQDVFQAVRWRDNRPLVQVGGKWYELVANGLPAEQIISLCQTLDPDRWQQRFEQDLVEVLVRSGKPYTSDATRPAQPASGPQATLEVKDLENGRIEVLTGCAHDRSEPASPAAGGRNPSGTLTIATTGAQHRRLSFCKWRVFPFIGPHRGRPN